MKDQPVLGKLIEGDAYRDAVHIAIAPVTAAGPLAPGQRIGFVEDDTDRVQACVENLLGIVDPYLEDWVREGDQFYMFLFPNTITALRHVWTHPAFTFKLKASKP